MSKKKKTPITPAQYEVLKAVCRDFDESHNRVMERTAQVVIPLVSYINNKVEDMVEALDGNNTPFSMKIRNKANGVISDEYGRIGLMDNYGYVRVTGTLVITTEYFQRKEN